MSLYNVPNLAYFTGQILRIDVMKSVTCLTVNVGREKGQDNDNHVHVYAFGEPKNIVDKYYKQGDLARLNCSVQAPTEYSAAGFYHTVVLYKIEPVRGDEVVPENRFAFLTNVLRIRDYGDGKLGVTVLLHNKGRDKFVAWVDMDEEQVEAFKNIKPYNRVQLFGYVKTGAPDVKPLEVCCIQDFNVLSDRRREAEAAQPDKLSESKLMQAE